MIIAIYHFLKHRIFVNKATSFTVPIPLRPCMSPLIRLCEPDSILRKKIERESKRYLHGSGMHCTHRYLEEWESKG